MDKQTFYTELLEKLTALGVGQEFIRQQLVKFEKIFKGMSDEESARFIDQFDDLDLLAERIKKAEEEANAAKQTTDGNVASESVDEGSLFEDVNSANAAKYSTDAVAQETEDPDSPSNGESSSNEDADDTNPPASETDESSADASLTDDGETDSDVPSGSAESCESEETAENEEAVEDDDPSQEGADGELPDVDGEDDNMLALSDDDVISFTPVGREEIFDDDDDYRSHSAVVSGRRRGEKKKKDDESALSERWNEVVFEDKGKNSKGILKFWLFFLLSLPIALAAIASTLVVFTILFFTIAVLIICFVAALVAVTAVGTLVSVFGLIFGVAQLLTSAPIGVYECGLAIMLGAAAMFIGILIYNVAVRLLPFLAKCLLRLFKLIFRSIRRFYVFLKRRCIGE